MFKILRYTFMLSFDKLKTNCSAQLFIYLLQARLKAQTLIQSQIVRNNVI